MGKNILEYNLMRKKVSRNPFQVEVEEKLGRNDDCIRSVTAPLMKSWTIIGAKGFWCRRGVSSKILTRYRVSVRVPR